MILIIMAIEALSLNEPLESSYRLYDIIYMTDFNLISIFEAHWYIFEIRPRGVFRICSMVRVIYGVCPYHTTFLAILLQWF